MTPDVENPLVGSVDGRDGVEALSSLAHLDCRQITARAARDGWLQAQPRVVGSSRSPATTAVAWRRSRSGMRRMCATTSHPKDTETGTKRTEPAIASTLARRHSHSVEVPQRSTTMASHATSAADVAIPTAAPKTSRLIPTRLAVRQRARVAAW